MQLTRKEYSYLKWAVGRAEEWRGSLTGDPDPRGLEEFDAAIAAAKRALRKVSPNVARPRNFKAQPLSF